MHSYARRQSFEQKFIKLHVESFDDQHKYRFVKIFYKHIRSGLFIILYVGEMR